MIKPYRARAINKLCHGFSLFFLVGGLLGGCASLPDTSGYTAASIQVKEAVGTSGDVVQAELASAIKAGATTANVEYVQNLKAAWAATMNSMDAMVA